MSNYKNQLEFIRRTKSLLDELEDKTKYEKTLFLNCCMGLLVAPQQWSKNDCFMITENASLDEWHVDPDKANPNSLMVSTSPNSVENIADHFRNCLCHKLFEVLPDSEQISKLLIEDYKDAMHEEKSFNLIISFEDFKAFVLKYAEEKMNLLSKELSSNHII